MDKDMEELAAGYLMSATAMLFKFDTTMLVYLHEKTGEDYTEVPDEFREIVALHSGYMIGSYLSFLDEQGQRP